MPKSRAEIQRAYRQRLKAQNDAEYLQKERIRMRLNYVSSASLSENDRKKRNSKNREKLRRFYERKRLIRSPNQTLQNETGETENEPSQERGRLRVKLNFPNNRRVGAIKRWKREVSEANSRIRLLEQERSELKVKYCSTQRALQRSRSRSSSKTIADHQSPRKETEKLMNEAKLTNAQKGKIRKPLLLGNVLAKEVNETKKQTPRRHLKDIHRTISGKIVKKYRCAKVLGRKTGLCRHRLTKGESKSHQIPRASRNSTVSRYRRDVEEFMKREDNSRMQPGKADTKIIGKGEKAQTYILSDYLFNLFQKFRSENPTSNISFASFCRTRPKYVLTAAFSSRSSCLCTKHQNAALTLKALRKVGVEISANPEKVIDNEPDAETLRNALEERIVISQWKRVEIEDRGKKKYVTKIVESQLNRDQFLSHFKEQMKEFKEHVFRVRSQYDQVRLLKENLPLHEIIVQIDFAENYSCKSVEEVQSAYFNQTCVTLHPLVAYYRSEDGSLQHKSFITISDEMAHRSSTVIAFLDDIMPELKQIDKGVQKIHYWSDSPTSQYRNKFMFDFVANHNENYGIDARWNYFEAGHGKGPCDGLGGTCKRLADEAMRAGKAVIQDAPDFFSWAVQSNMKNVAFGYVSAKKCNDIEQIKGNRNVKPVKDTFKIHAVVGLGESEIKVREVSCYCDSYIRGNLCDTWRLARTSSDERKNNEEPKCALVMAEKEPVAENIVDQGKEEFALHDNVGAVYEGEWFIGEICDMDETEYEINFMETKKIYFSGRKKLTKSGLLKLMSCAR